MRYIVNNIIIPVLLLMLASCAGNNRLSESKNTIAQLSGRIIPDGSLIYGLPLTVLNITVETERVIEKPGPYARYAEDLLGLKDVIRSENEYWSIKYISVKTHEELDPSGFYVIQASGLFQTNAFTLKKAGLILDLNPELYNSLDAKRYSRENEIDHLRISDLGADEYFKVRRDTAYRIVSLDTAFIRIPYLVEKKQKLTTDQLADRAARRLMEMRDGKHLILTGEANVFPQSDAAIREMNRLEKEYTELFVGKTWSETKSFTYQVIPGREMAGKPVILTRFSEATGPAKSADQSGIPLNIEFLPEKKTSDITLPVQSKQGSSASKPDKLFYRIPDVVNVKVSLGNENLYTSRELIYQFGTIVQLPSNYIIGK